MRILLSIKPEFAEKIFSGEKQYEFRRVIFKKNNVEKVVIYASAPVGKIIGEFEIETVLTGDLEALWDRTKHWAGITKEYFMGYFNGRTNGYAIKIGKHSKYKSPRSIKSAFGMKPPQSFAYV